MRRLVIALGILLSVLGFGGAAVSAADDVAPVDVLQVDGLLDHVVASEIITAVERSATNGAQALILQVNSKGSLLTNEEIDEVLVAIDNSRTPVAVWVGPTGADLLGASAHLLAVADVSGMAPGAKIGSLDPRIIAPNAEGAARIAPLAGDIVGLSEARDLGVLDQRVSDEGIATIANMLDALNGYSNGVTTLVTTEEVVTEEGTVQRNTIATPRFSKLGLFDQLLHTVASPPVAYLLLLIGLGLLIFEFFTAGVGVAGLVGAVSTLLAGYGIAELPARSWAVALIVLAMLAFAVDVQVGLPRTWTGIGIVLTIIGSLWLFESVPGASLRPTWLSLVAGIGGVILSFTAGMPSMTRTRFATPTIGREWMVGSEGTVVESVDPEGIVNVGGADWRARTNRATPVNAGDTIKVVAIDGITLEVEPLEGAARDYRR